jgi:hypothetical protein
MSSREITVTRRLPAARKLANDWRAFSKLMTECDELVAVEEALRERLDELSERRPGAALDMEISDAELDEETKAQIERCKQALERFDPPEHYEENDNEGGVLKSEIIAERLALMLGCVDTGPTNTEPEAFARMMVTHVYDSEITYPALLSGCRAIEQAQKPVRSIGYVLEVLEEHRGEWADRKLAIYWTESTANRLRDAIVEAQAKSPLEQAEQKVELAKSTVDRAARVLEDHRKVCEEAKRAAIEALHKYQREQRRMIGAEHRLGESKALLAAAKAHRAKLEASKQTANKQTEG